MSESNSNTDDDFSDEYEDEFKMMSEEEVQFQQARMKNAKLVMITLAIITLIFIVGVAGLIFIYFKAWESI
ncbi:MAG TPA: hypothetical protein VD947_01695 [Patescibacteria group bacterium]|nr:hypothetical protein [Patescibacteria group bacterium]